MKEEISIQQRWKKWWKPLRKEKEENNLIKWDSNCVPEVCVWGWGLIEWIMRLFRGIDVERVPDDQKNAYIVPLLKGDGEKNVCSDCKGFTEYILIFVR